MRAIGLALSLVVATAPFQCPGDPDPQLRREESAPEAVWMLAERFHRTGRDDARRDTLRFLIERYPSSRFAARARLELGAGSDEPPAERGAAPASQEPATGSR